MREIFSQGQWVALTALFVFTPSSGATLRAARDRLLGIFIGTSYAFIALLILRNILGENAPLSIVGIVIFVVVFAVVILILLQDNPALASACIYAVILLLFSAPANEEIQGELVLSNFLNTFFGAAIVTLLSAYSFFFRSSRYELLKSMDQLSASLADELVFLVSRLDLSLQHESEMVNVSPSFASDNLFRLKL